MSAVRREGITQEMILPNESLRSRSKSFWMESAQRSRAMAQQQQQVARMHQMAQGQQGQVPYGAGQGWGMARPHGMMQGRPRGMPMLGPPRMMGGRPMGYPPRGPWMGGPRHPMHGPRFQGMMGRGPPFYGSRPPPRGDFREVAVVPDRRGRDNFQFLHLRRLTIWKCAGAPRRVVVLPIRVIGIGATVQASLAPDRDRGQDQSLGRDQDQDRGRNLATALMEEEGPLAFTPTLSFEIQIEI